MIKLDTRDIEEMVQTIVRESQPERVYLLGSYATGEAREDSDIDLLIIVDGEFDNGRGRWAELQRIRRSISHFRTAKDILLYSRSEAERMSTSLNHIVAHAVREGRLLYERH